MVCRTGLERSDGRQEISLMRAEQGLGKGLLRGVGRLS